MENYAAKIEDARKAFATGRTRPLEWRKQQLRNFIRMLEENEAVFAKALNDDINKPKQEAVTLETGYLANIALATINDLDVWAEDEYVEKNMLTMLDTTYIRREPLGVVLVVGAWNYPVQLSLAPVVGAIAAGNAVFVKPSELAPASAETIANLLPRYLDPELFKVVTGGIPETTELLKQRFDYIFFTGSTGVGKIVAAAASKHLTPCTLELGGKCPVFMDSSVNMEIAVKRILWGKMINLGQTCVAPDYLICDEATRDKFVATAKRVYRDFFGPDASKSPDLGRFINDRNFDRVKKLLDETAGVVAFYGGKTDAFDRFMDLSIVTEVTAEDSLMSEELFGPVLPVVTAKTTEEAIAFVNAREKPLSLYIFSEDAATKKKIVDGTSSGSVCMNDVIVQLSVETLPFGGVGSSGYGAYHGRYTFRTFSHAKSVLVRDFGFIGENLGIARYPPYSDRKIATLASLVKTRSFPKVPFWLIKYSALMGLGAWIANLYPLLVEKYNEM